MNRFRTLRLRTVNNWLTLIVVILALYVIGMPFLPAMTWWAKHEAPVVSHPASIAVPKPHTTEVPADNTLFIPRLGMSEVVHDGPTIHTLRLGVWHLPDSSSPDKGGNTVMAGHRYTYSGSGVFYHLDLVKTGDPLTVYWNHKRYDYSVTNILVVPPSDTSVVAASKQPRLTIYTCTPTWTFKNRLVIEASLESIS